VFDEDVAQDRNDAPACDVKERAKKVDEHHQTSPILKGNCSKQ
jgi:hypothetical protein